MVEKKNNPPQNRAIFLAFIPPVIVLLAALYSIPVVRKTVGEALRSLPSLPWQTIMLEGIRILFSLLVYSAVLYASFFAMAAYNALRHWYLTGNETRHISVWMSFCLIVTILGLARKPWEVRNGSIADIVAVCLCFLTAFVIVCRVGNYFIYDNRDCSRTDVILIWMFMDADWRHAVSRLKTSQDECVKKYLAANPKADYPLYRERQGLFNNPYMPYLPAGRGDKWVEHNLEDLKAYAERIPMLKIELGLWEELSEENALTSSQC